MDSHKARMFGEAPTQILGGGGNTFTISTALDTKGCLLINGALPGGTAVGNPKFKYISLVILEGPSDLTNLVFANPHPGSGAATASAQPAGREIHGLTSGAVNTGTVLLYLF